MLVFHGLQSDQFFMLFMYPNVLETGLLIRVLFSIRYWWGKNKETIKTSAKNPRIATKTVNNFMINKFRVVNNCEFMLKKDSFHIN